MPRELLPGQTAELRVVHVDTGENILVHSSGSVLFEAPNWTPDGRSLIVNGAGGLFRVSIDGGDLLSLDLAGIPPVNNDHVLSPDGDTVYVSADDGHLYACSLSGGPVPSGGSAPDKGRARPSCAESRAQRVTRMRRVSNERASFTYYLHGVSPDGQTLAYIGLEPRADGTATTNVYTIPSAGGADVQITNDEFADDGCEFSPDGRWIYFNSERAGTRPGHAQLFRMSNDGGDIEQLTFDERVNWFPHPAPSGRTIAYVSFPPGTQGHPENRDVIIRLLDLDRDDSPIGTPRDLVHLFGGQGTMNVPSWDPAGRSIAFVSYPLQGGLS